MTVMNAPGSWPLMSDLELVANHEYVVEIGGKPKISVTRISGLVDDGKTDGLMRWATWLAAQGENYLEVREYKADRGSRIHAHMPAWARGETVQARADELGYLQAAANWRIESGAISIESEQIVLSSLGYGGMFDDISEIEGELWGIDFKSGRLKDRENELQHAGYWNADLGIGVYDEDGMLIGYRPLPDVTRWATLGLKDDGTYDFREAPVRRRGQGKTPIKELQDEAWRQFQALLAHFAWLHPTLGVTV